MNRFKLIVAAILMGATPLTAGCAALQNAVSTGSSVCANSADPAKAMFAAEALYNAPAQAYVTADQHGLLSPALKAQLKPLLQKAYGYLKSARVAYNACDQNTLAAYSNALSVLAGQVTALIPHS